MGKGKNKGGKKKNKENKNNGGNQKKEEAKKVEKPKKLKDIMGALPKTSMNMDDWKREFSGVDRTEESQRKACKWLWENLDNEGYSIWLQEYNYNAENKKGWMTSNYVNGFLQRTEEIRKW